MGGQLPAKKIFPITIFYRLLSSNTFLHIFFLTYIFSVFSPPPPHFLIFITEGKIHLYYNYFVFENIFPVRKKFTHTDFFFFSGNILSIPIVGKNKNKNSFRIYRYFNIDVKVLIKISLKNIMKNLSRILTWITFKNLWKFWSTLQHYITN